MPLKLSSDHVMLEGDLDLEDARGLDRLLREDPERAVCLSACGHMHAAVAQVILVLGPRLRGRPEDAFVRDWLLPALRRHSAEGGSS